MTFFEKYQLWSQAFPPAARDMPTQESFAPLGLTGDVPVAKLAEPVTAALEAGYAAGKAAVAESLRGGHVEVVNGWMQTFHVFDYNLDFFEAGTIDDPAWNCPTTRNDMSSGLGPPWAAFGEPRVRGDLPRDIHRQRRAAARRLAQLYPPAEPHPASEGILVADHVRRTQLFSHR
jgi:hypothetical protein